MIRDESGPLFIDDDGTLFRWIDLGPDDDLERERIGSLDCSFTSYAVTDDEEPHYRRLLADWRHEQRMWEGATR